MFRRLAATSVSSLRRNSRTGTASTFRPLFRSMISGRGPSLITILFTTWIFVMLTVWLMTVVLFTITVVGRRGSRRRCSLTKTNARGAIAVS